MFTVILPFLYVKNFTLVPLFCDLGNIFVYSPLTHKDFKRKCNCVRIQDNVMRIKYAYYIEFEYCSYSLLGVIVSNYPDESINCNETAYKHLLRCLFQG